MAADLVTGTCCVVPRSGSCPAVVSCAQHQDRSLFWKQRAPVDRSIRTMLNLLDSWLFLISDAILAVSRWGALIVGEY